MKLFKNPVFAIILTVVTVIASTLLNTNVKFGRECNEVRDLFYEGVTREYTQPSLASHLENLVGYAEGLATIARNYDVDTQQLEWDIDVLRSVVSSNNPSFSYHCYTDLNTALSSVIDQLERRDLEARDASGISQYKSAVAGVQSAVGESWYNDVVRTFLRTNDRFPTNVLADLAHVHLPELFA